MVNKVVNNILTWRKLKPKFQIFMGKIGNKIKKNPDLQEEGLAIIEFAMNYNRLNDEDKDMIWVELRELFEKVVADIK